MPTEFGVWLRRARKANSLSMEEVARRAEITYSHVSRIESGRTAASRRTVFLLVRAIGGDMHEGLLAAGYVPRDLDVLGDTQTLRVAKAFNALSQPLKDEIERILALLTESLASPPGLENTPHLSREEQAHLQSQPLQLTEDAVAALAAFIGASAEKLAENPESTRHATHNAETAAKRRKDIPKPQSRANSQAGIPQERNSR